MSHITINHELPMYLVVFNDLAKGDSYARVVCESIPESGYFANFAHAKAPVAYLNYVDALIDAQLREKNTRKRHYVISLCNFDFQGLVSQENGTLPLAIHLGWCGIDNQVAYRRNGCLASTAFFDELKVNPTARSAYVPMNHKGIKDYKILRRIDSWGDFLFRMKLMADSQNHNFSCEIIASQALEAIRYSFEPVGEINQFSFFNMQSMHWQFQPITND